MFEQIVGNLLEKYLKEFIHEWDARQLGLGVWQGEVALDNLVLRPDLLADQDCTISFSLIESIRIQIPWRSLFPTPSKPVVARVSGIYIVITPNPSASTMDEATRAKVESARKQKELAKFEESKKPVATKSDKSFVERLIASIVNNIQVVVEKIHVRYEDSTSNPEHPFAAGFTLAELSAISTDENWQPNYIKGVPDFVHKLLKLDSCGVYFASDTRMIMSLPPPGRKQAMLDMIAKQQTQPADLQYLLSPISISVKAVVNERGLELNQPKFTLDVSVDRLMIGLDEDQYRDTLYIIDSLSRSKRRAKYRHIRSPTSALEGSGAAREWWAYAIACVQSDIHRVHVVWSWQYFAARREKRQQYVSTYMDLLAVKDRPPKALQAALAELEDGLDVEDVKLYREIAQSRMPKVTKGTSNLNRITSWFFSSGTTEIPSVAGPITLTPDQKQQVFAAIGYKSGEQSPNVEPIAYVMAVCNYRVSVIGLELRRSKANLAQRDSRAPLRAVYLSLNVDTVSGSISYRPSAEAVKIESTVTNLRLVDAEHSSSRDFPTLMQCQAYGDQVLPFMRLLFEQKPLDGSANDKLHMSMEPLEIVCHPNVITNLTCFFSTPEGLLLDDAVQIAAYGVQTVKDYSRTGLEYAIATHKTIDLALSIAAPKVVLMSSDEQSAMIVDLGSLIVESRPFISNVGLHEISEDNLYDKFTIRVHDAQIILLKDSEAVTRALVTESLKGISNKHLLAPTSLTLDVWHCIQRDNHELPVLKFGTTLNPVELRLSDKKIATLAEFAALYTPPPAPKASMPALPAAPNKTTSAPIVATAPSKALNSQAPPELRVLSPPSLDVPAPLLDQSDILEADPDMSRRTMRSASVRSGATSFYSADEGDTAWESASSELKGDFHSTRSDDSLPNDAFESSRKDLYGKSALSRVSIQADAELRLIRIVLSRWDAVNEQDKPLLDLQVTALKLTQFQKRVFDMQCSATLESIDIIDLISVPYAAGANAAQHGTSPVATPTPGSKDPSSADLNADPMSAASADARSLSGKSSGAQTPSETNFNYLLKTQTYVGGYGQESSSHLGEKSFMAIDYHKVEVAHPLFRTQHNSTEQLIKLSLGSLELNPIHETLQELLDFSKSLTAQLKVITANSKTLSAFAGLDPPGESLDASILSDHPVFTADAMVGTSTPSSATPTSPVPTSPLPTFPTGSGRMSMRSLMSRFQSKPGSSTAASVSIALYVKLDNISIMLTSKTARIANLTVGGLSSHFSLGNSSIVLHTQLALLSLMDLTPQASDLHRSIISVQGSEVFSLDVTHHTDDPYNRYALDFDTSVQFKLSGLRFVVLARFLREAINFASTLLPSVPADGVAADVVPDNTMVDAQTSPWQEMAPLFEGAPNQPQLDRRLKLNIEIKAPIIVVPLHSGAERVLIFDLGTLLVDNDLDVDTVENVFGGKLEVLLDRMQVNLQEVALYLCNLSPKDCTATSKRKSILAPATMSITVVRYLHHPLPNNAYLDLRCIMGKIQLTADELDAQEVMTIVHKNITEQATVIVVPAMPETSSPSSASLAADDDDADIQAKPGSTRQSSQPTSSDAPTTAAAAATTPAAAVAPTAAELAKQSESKASSKFVSKDITAAFDFSHFEVILRRRAQGDSLLNFGVNNVTGTIGLLSNHTAKGSLTIGSMALTDLRRDAHGPYTHVMTHRKRVAPTSGQVSPSQDIPFLSCDFNRQEFNQSGVVRLAHVRVLACVDFVAAVLGFAETAVESFKPAVAAAADKKPSEAAPNAPKISASRLDQQQDEPMPPLLDIPESEGVSSNFHFLITDLQVTAVAKPDDSSIPALRFTADGSASVIKNATQDNVCLALTDMSFMTCQPFGSKSERQTILAPCQLTLSVTRSIDGLSQQIHVYMPTINVRFSSSQLIALQRFAEVWLASQKHLAPQAEEAFDFAGFFLPADVKPTTWYFWQPHQRQPRQTRHQRALAHKGLAHQISASSARAPKRHNTLQATMPSMDVLILDDTRTHSVPLLAVSAAFELVREDDMPSVASEHIPVKWNGQLGVAIASYNSSVAAWEPVIEPVRANQLAPYEPWTLDLRVLQIPASTDNPSGCTSVYAAASQPLEITVSSRMLSGIMQSDFVSALKGTPEDDVTAIARPLNEKTDDIVELVVVNRSGRNVKVSIGNAAKPDAQTIQVLSDEQKPLSFSPDTCTSSIFTMRAVKMARPRSRKYITIEAEGTSALQGIPVDVPAILSYVLDTTPACTLICEVVVVNSTKMIIIRSPVEIHNDLSEDIEVATDPIKQRGVLVKSGQSHYLPIGSSLTHGFYVRPSVDYQWPDQPLRIKEETQFASCLASGALQSCVQGEKPRVRDLGVSCETIKCSASAGGPVVVRMVVSSLLTVRNWLPYRVLARFAVAKETLPFQSVSIEPDQSIQLCVGAALQPVSMSVCCPAFSGDERWSAYTHISHIEKATSDSIIIRNEDKNTTLHLDLVYERHDATRFSTLSIAAPYWLVNQTGCQLQCRQMNGEHAQEHTLDAGDALHPALYSFHRAATADRKLRIKIGSSSWSEGISIDAVGREGLVSIPFPNHAVELCVSVSLSANNTTKILRISPPYLIVNYLKVPVVVQEVATDSNDPQAPTTVAVPAEAHTPFWPALMSSQITIKVGNASSAPFCYTQPLSSLVMFKENEQLQAVALVDISPEGIKVMPSPKAADLRIENRCATRTVIFKQCDESRHVQLYRVSPGKSLHYIADNPDGLLAIEWLTDGEVDLTKWRKHEFSSFKYEQFELVNGPMYCVGFPDDAQRVFLFCDEKHDALRVCKATGSHVDSPQDAEAAAAASKMTDVTFTFALRLAQVGLSLVENQGKARELGYLCMRGRHVLQWQSPTEDPLTGDTWIRFDAKDDVLLRKAIAKDVKKPIKLADNVYANPSTMQLTYTVDNRTHLAAMRVYLLPALSVDMYDSRASNLIELALEYLQIDDMTEHPMLPIVLHPAPQRQARHASRSFFKLKFHRIKPEQHQASMLMVKQFSIGFQEMNLSLSEPFMLNMLDFANKALIAPQIKAMVEADMKAIREAFKRRHARASMHVSRMSCELLQIHPLQVNVTFTLDPTPRHSENRVRRLLKAISATVSHLEGVPLRLNALYLTHVFATREELLQQIIQHYTIQGLTEVYKLFGCMDFIGNPVKLFGQLSTGVVDMFYEPFLADDLSEFGDAVIAGVQSMASNTIAGTTGLLSRVTGSIGDSFALLSMDKSYQDRRRQASTHHAHPAARLGTSGKRVLKGFMEGVGGLIMEPARGASADGATGFIKGVGKGLLGVIVKPVGGVIDFTSSAFDAISQAVDNGEVTERLRAPRFIPFDGVITCYSAHEAYGVVLLSKVTKFAFAANEVYQFHLPISENLTAFFTTVHLLIVKHHSVVFAVLLDEICRVSIPPKDPRVLDIEYATVRDRRKKGIVCESPARARLFEWQLKRMELRNLVAN